MAVWAKESAQALVYFSCVDDSRQVLVGDADAWVGFAVFQQYIVARIPLLYQVVLQKQGILLGVNYNIFYVMNLGNKHTCLKVIVFSVEVAANPTLQVLGLSNVDDSATLIEILIASGQFW